MTCNIRRIDRRFYRPPTTASNLPTHPKTSSSHYIATHVTAAMLSSPSLVCYIRVRTTSWTILLLHACVGWGEKHFTCGLAGRIYLYIYSTCILYILRVTPIFQIRIYKKSALGKISQIEFTLEIIFSPKMYERAHVKLIHWIIIAKTINKSSHHANQNDFWIKWKTQKKKKRLNSIDINSSI